MSTDFFNDHQAVLEQAVAAAATRGYWSPFSESPSPRAYGETANADGRAAFEAYQGKAFPLSQEGAAGQAGGGSLAIRPGTEHCLSAGAPANTDSAVRTRA